MDWLLNVGGLAFIFGVFTYFLLRSERGGLDRGIDEFAATVPAPLTDEVRAWLRPQFRRRSTYPMVGFLWGIGMANLPTAGWNELPWYWFALVLGMSLGAVAGQLLAGLRTAPLVQGQRRTAEAARRRVTTYFDRASVLKLRLAVALAVLSMALAAALVATSGSVSSWRALVGCGLATLLAIAHVGVAAAVLRRPLVASSQERLQWQKALLAMTLDGLPSRAWAVGLVSAAIAVFATINDARVVPVAVAALGAAVALAATASALLVVHRSRADRQELPAAAGGPAQT